MDNTSPKQVRLVLASASISTIPEKFLRDIFEFTGTPQRDICKRLTTLVHQDIQKITLKQSAYHELISRYANPEPVKNALYSYASKCSNLKVVDLLFDCFYVFCSKQLRPIMEELFQIRPSITSFITMESNEWILSTPLGNLLYNLYSPHVDLKPENVLDIVCLSLMSFDGTTLQRFGLSVLPVDFLTENGQHGVVRKTANIQHCMGFIKTCVHYYNLNTQRYGTRRVFLYQQNAMWKIMSICDLVQNYEVPVCPVCNTL